MRLRSCDIRRAASKRKESLFATRTAISTYSSIPLATQQAPDAVVKFIWRYMPAANWTTVCNDGAVTTGVPAANASKVLWGRNQVQKRVHRQIMSQMSKHNRAQNEVTNLTPPPQGKGSSATSAAAISATNSAWGRRVKNRKRFTSTGGRTPSGADNLRSKRLFHHSCRALKMITITPDGSRSSMDAMATSKAG